MNEKASLKKGVRKNSNNFTMRPIQTVFTSAHFASILVDIVVRKFLREVTELLNYLIC